MLFRLRQGSALCFVDGARWRPWTFGRMALDLRTFGHIARVQQPVSGAPSWQRISRLPSTPLPPRPCFAEHAWAAVASEAGWARDLRALTRRALGHRKKTSRPTGYTCCVSITFLWAGCMNMCTWAYYSQYSGVNSKTNS